MNGLKGKAKRLVVNTWNDYSVMFVFIVIIIICSIVEPGFFSWTNLTGIFRSCSAVGIMALGMTYIIISGGIDLSMGSCFAVCGVILVWLQGNGIPLPLAILASCLFGMLNGFVNGFLISKFVLPPFIVTLATQTLLRSVVKYVTNGTTVKGLKDPVFMAIGNGSLPGGLPIAFLICLTLALMMHIVLSKTKFGTYVYALGGNEITARYTGIQVDKVKILIYMLAGVMTALASVVEVSRMASVAPTSSGVSYETEAIICAVVGGTAFTGGKGKIPGTVIGAVILYVIFNMLVHLNISTYLSGAVKGMVILVAVLLQKRDN